MNPYRPMPHRPSVQVERDLNEIRHRLQNADPLPSIPALEALVQKWTTKATLDPIHRGDLQSAVHDLENAKQLWADRARDNTTVSNLQREFDEAQAAERIEKATAADERLNEAINEYQHACLIAARALRTVLNVQRMSQQVPGANHNLSHLRLHQFHIPSLYPLSFQGTLGQAMIEGTAQFEQQNDFSTRPTLKVA